MTYIGLSKNYWKPVHWNSSPVWNPTRVGTLWHPNLVGASSIPPRFSPLPSGGRHSKRSAGKQQRQRYACAWRSLEKKKNFSVKQDASKELALCLECQLNRVLGRGIFKITCLYLCNYHVILKVSREMPNERQICHTFHILQLNIPTVTCLSCILYTGI